MPAQHEACRIYLITPPRLDLPTFQRAFTEALEAGDVAAVQLRLKDTDDDTWKRVIDVLRPIAQSRNVSFLLNDRVDLVKPTGCDGVHVGQEDTPAPEARRILGPSLTLGVTCKGSRHLSMQAAEDGADYVAFGAFFPSTTKDVSNTITPEIIEWWSELMELPSCAIGGITPENCAGIVKAGADFLAVSGCIWNDRDGPGAGIRKLNAAIKAATP
jgi:thiamine-phosphate pyrophosphorylase